MNYIELNLFPEEEEEIQKDSDSDGSKKNRSVESNEYDYAVKENTTLRICLKGFQSRHSAADSTSHKRTGNT